MTFRGRSVLVTGAAGFIGSHLVDRLVAEGAVVTAVDNLSTGTLDNLVQVRDAVRFVHVDVRDRSAVRSVVAGQEYVFHLAANADVPYSVEHPEYDFESNALGSHHVLRACVEHKVTRVVFASTAAVYGNPSRVPIDESHPRQPVSPYGVSKLAGEQLGLVYHSVYGLPFTAVRIFNTYGERQARYVMFDLLAKIHRSPNDLVLLGDGSQRRDFCHVDDACRLLTGAALSDELLGDVVNLAAGSPITIRDLSTLMVDLLGRSATTRVSFTGQSWQGDIVLLLGDASKARRVLGWNTTVDLRTGIHRLVDWLETHKGWKLRA